MNAKQNIKQNNLNSIVQQGIFFWMTSFGLGLIPWIPGTFGTIGALPIYWICTSLTEITHYIIHVIFFFIGCYCCGLAQTYSGVQDDSRIVWDEVMGFWFILLIVKPDLYMTCLLFLLFRFFDIVKPWPIQWFDHYFKNGFGIMIDDYLAAFYTLFIYMLMYVFVMHVL